MIGREQYARFLSRRGIVEMRGPEVQTALAVFKERTDGFLDIAWHKHGWTPEKLAQAFEQYGFDCYTQGCIDCATTARMRPELVEYLNSFDSGGEDHAKG